MSDHLHSERGLLTASSRRVVEAAKLLTTAGRRKYSAFLAEGPNSVYAALHAQCASELFITEHDAHDHPEIVSIAERSLIPVRWIDQQAARKLTHTVTPVGVIVRCSLLDRERDQIIAEGTQRFLAVLVEPSDPGNLGTVVRAAHALGASGCLILGEGVDPHNPKAIRSSAGSIFTLPFSREKNLAAGLAALRAAKVTLLATTANGEVPVHEAGPLLQGPCAWLFGNEAHGLPESVVSAADYRISVPMFPAPGVALPESLNMAVAAGICLYETARARLR